MSVRFRLALVLLCFTCLSCETRPTRKPPPATTSDPEEARPEKKLAYALAIHGGAGDIGGLTKGQRAPYVAGLSRALRRGTELLKSGASSLDVVEAVVSLLEDDALFNAGRGAVFNSKGEHELDASIMRGSDKSCGAVAGVRTTKNPVQAARAVMEKSRHILLSGQGADRFAEEQALARVANTYFSTEHRRSAWEKKNKVGKHGTVGAVAIDTAGHLAAATSTGGLSNKKWGRVGDSPIVGAGTYADDATCAVSGTGIGEEFIRHAVAFSVSARMKWLDESAEQAAMHMVEEVLKPADGGVIVVSKDGEIVFSYNTTGMFRGAADSDGRFEIMVTEAAEPLP